MSNEYLQLHHNDSQVIFFRLDQTCFGHMLPSQSFKGWWRDVKGFRETTHADACYTTISPCREAGHKKLDLSQLTLGGLIGLGLMER